MASLPRKIALISRLQLAFLSATWLAGIYVNGFVPILPGTGTEAILLNPAIASHVILASLSAATSVLIVALSWAGGSRKPTMLALLATLSIVLAGGSGLAFVLGGASDSSESFIMACAFITAVFLTFLSMANQGGGNRRSESGGAAKPSTIGAVTISQCYLALLLFYGTFVSGIYVNLFVAGPVFSLPLNAEPAAFTEAEHSAAFVTHEVLGAAVLVVLAIFAASLLFDGARRLSLVAAVPALLVAYSAYVGSLNLTAPLTPVGSALVPMLSAAALMAAIVVAMLITLRLWSDLRPG